MKLVLRNNDGESVSLQIKPNETFSELKERIEEEVGIILDLKDIALQGKKIIDSQKVLDYFFNQDLLDDNPTTLPDHKCVVPGCFNTKSSNPEKSFFHFPQEEIRCHQWALYCQRLNMMSGKRRLVLDLDSTICSDHFRSDQFVKNTTTLLKRTAVPCKSPDLPVADSTQLKRVNAIIQKYTSDKQNLTTQLHHNFKMMKSLNENIDKTFEDHVTLDSSNVDLVLREDKTFDDHVTLHSSNVDLDLRADKTFDDHVTLDSSNVDLDLRADKTFDDHVTLDGSNVDLDLRADKTFGDHVALDSSNVDLDLRQDKTFDDHVTLDSSNVDLDLRADKSFEDHVTLHSSNVDLDLTEGDEPSSSSVQLLSDSIDLQEGEEQSSNDPDHVVTDEMDLNSVEDARDTLCRLCARPSNDCIFIFDEDGLQLGIAEKISACLPIAVKRTDPLPKQVCRECCGQLDQSYALAEACINAENKLKTLKTENFFRLSLRGDHHNNSQVTDELSDSSPINGSNEQPHLDCPLCLDGTMQKTNKESNLETNESSKSEEESCSSKTDLESSDKTDHESSDKTDHENSNKTDLESSDKTDPESLSLSHIVEELIDESNEEKDPENLIANLEEMMEIGLPEESVESDETEWLPTIATRSMDEIYLYSCRLCCADFRTFQAVTQHSLMHSDDGLYFCTLCDSNFTSQDDLEGHFMSKHNPENKHDQNIFCNFCGAQFRTPELLNYHRCLSVNLTSNKCKVCCKSFRSVGRLLFHMKFHSGAKPGYCDICQKTFPDEVKLYKHVMYLHTTDKTHCCEECGKVFKSVSSLRYHQRSHQGEEVMKPYSCDQCGKCFIRKSMLRNHVTTSHKQESQEGSCFTCKHCHEAFPTTTSAVAHMDVQHKTECNENNTYSFEMHTVNRLYICEYCERCFTESTTLNSHRDHHLTENPYQCKFCGEVFSSFGEHSEHKLKHEGQEACAEYAGTFDIPTAYLCEYCDRNFLNYIKFSEHLTVHYGTAPYHCRFCNLKFSNSTDLILHRATHQTAPNEEFNYYRPYECHYCNKTFAIEDALVKHIRMHTGEKPFICDQCGKGFSQSSGLYTHQKVHSNERPYACPVCPRKFKIKGDRDVHVRKHSGDRPYKCEFCGKAFMTQHVYSQHRKIHTGERPYKCDVCGISFRRSHVLTVHKRIHTGEKPNVCDVCGKRYRQKGDMLKHRRVQHGHVKVKLQKIEY